MVLLRGRSLFLFCAGWTKYNLDDMVKVCVDFLAWSSLSLRNHLDERVKDFGKVLVAVPVSSIDATVLVVKLDRASNCLKGEIILWKMDLLAECDFLLISLASSTAIPTFAKVKPLVAVFTLESLSHKGFVTYFATRECVDLISGKGSPIVVVVVVVLQ